MHYPVPWGRHPGPRGPRSFILLIQSYENRPPWGEHQWDEICARGQQVCPAQGPIFYDQKRLLGNFLPY
jgi:hypothetical protein